MNGPPAGPAKQLTEEDKRQLRNQHREQIKNAREEALLCREQFKEQTARGEIGDDLYVDLVTATFGYWMQTRASVKDSRYEDDCPDTRALWERVVEADVPVYEHDDLDAKEFAAHIDAIDAIVLKSGLLEMER
jgi:hypothetical protein